MNNFDLLSADSKVWVYQSDRKLTDTETAEIKSYLDQFTEQWTAHSKKVKATGDVLFNHFIVLMADETETEVSGCSIDASIHFLKELENRYQINLFNRLIVAFQKGEEVISVPLEDFKEFFEEGDITEETIVFNNMITTKADFEASWQIPLKQSWHKEYLS